MPWRQVADPDLRPFVRLFFEVLAAGDYDTASASLERFIDMWEVVGTDSNAPAATATGTHGVPTEDG